MQLVVTCCNTTWLQCSKVRDDMTTVEIVEVIELLKEVAQ